MNINSFSVRREAIRLGERIFKTDMRYITTGGFWLSINQVLSSGSAFLLSIAFANLLPPEIFGTYKYVLSIVSLLIIPTLSGIDSAVIQAVARGFEGTLVVGVKTKMKWGAIGAVGAIIAATYYYFNGNDVMTISLLIAAVFIPLNDSLDLYNSLLNGKKLFAEYTRWNSAKKILSAAALITTLFATHNLFAVLIAYFLPTLVFNAALLHRTLKHHVINRTSDPEAMTYGKHLSVVTVLSTILGELDKILVFHYLGAIDLAIFALASAPTDQIKGVIKNINSLAFPKFTQQTGREIKKNIGYKIVVLVSVTSLIIACYVVLAPFLFGLFFPKYLESIKYSQILAISIVPITAASFIQTILHSQKAKKEIYEYSIYSNIFTLMILFPLVYYFGIWGAVISRVTTRFFTFGLANMLVRKIPSEASV